MSNLPHLIDNVRINLEDVLKKIAPNYTELSIATGYWDLIGTSKLIDLLQRYTKIRILIGQEPMSYRYSKLLKLDFENPDKSFPSLDIAADLEKDGTSEDQTTLRKTAVILAEMVKEGKLEVKVYRKTTLHAKAYIFGGEDSNNSIGIVGSSNFTGAGLKTNTELNTLEDDYRIISFKPSTSDQENGYLSWFESLWNDDGAVEWTGEFKKILESSPVGDMCYGPYDSYIKTLMEVFPDEMIPPQPLDENTSDILFSFQNRNAGILINKLAKNGVAILADSVGLGKTVTAGAVIKHYLDKSDQKANILVIAPAALKQQWIDDLSSILKIDYLDGAYRIVSQQDSNAIDHIYDEYEKEWRRQKSIDLFVIDEAHNLRSNIGRRHDSILKLLQQHPKADILLLTATPINNSLMDIANIIQLASKGKINSVNVSYPRPDGSGTELIDFFEALKRIQSSIKKAEKNGDNVDNILQKVKPTIHEGLRHYLVRSTRQGVEAEGGIIDKKTGIKKSFPKSVVTSITYEYGVKETTALFDAIGNHITDTFEGLDPRKLNLMLMTNFTQQSCHPLDFLNEILLDESKMNERFSLSNKDVDPNETLYLGEPVKNLVHNILQIIFVMGFTPYRPDIYQHKYWNKTLDEIKALKDVPDNVRVQLAVHNILQITWLKRMESSGAALMYSVINYEKRLNLFEKYLNKGFIVNLLDASLLESDYNDGEDIEQAFADYDKYLEEKESLINSGEDPDSLKKQGVEKKIADPKYYNIKQIFNDLEREKKIILLLKRALKELIKPENDTKAQKLHDEIKNALSSGKYGKKVLVFSFFADTINYLKENSKELFSDIDADFENHSAFIFGQSSKVDNIVQRFSPTSKHYEIKPNETEINYLFSTDILSEGQNLQDAGYLINYDLHWNPVRMIQRNGRINRLGSDYKEVLISNMRPNNELELYLNLVNRLERKIKTIRNTIGLDQGVLSSSDENPIEFIEKYYSDGTLPDEDDDLLSHSDKHIIELRKFLSSNPKGSKGFELVNKMPLGKWNYLSNKTDFNENSIGMIKVNGKTVKSFKPFSELFFVTIKEDGRGEYVASYVDYAKALDIIKADEGDNEKLTDHIMIDRQKVSKRAYAEANRQASNPSQVYKLTPQYIKALQYLASNYLQKDLSLSADIIGTIEKGVTTIDLRSNLEKNLRQINKEAKEEGSLYASTVTEFENIFKSIQENVAEDKNVEKIMGVLYYARQQ